MFAIFKLIECYSSRDRNAIHLPQKSDLKNETVIKKSESAYIFNSQNRIKQGIMMVNHFDKNNILKS